MKIQLAQLYVDDQDDTARAHRDQMKAKGTPATSFVTHDIAKDYETLSARGVVFTMPPTTMDYGGTDAVFEDGLGNLLNLHQD